jgi:hypothetical protein
MDIYLGVIGYERIEPDKRIYCNRYYTQDGHFEKPIETWWKVVQGLSTFI